MAEDDVTGVVVRRIIHRGEVVPGSVTGTCGQCGAAVWIAPSTRDAMAHGSTTEMRCCCCVNVHDLADWQRLALVGVAHVHRWGSFGRCECGMDRAQWHSEIGHLRD